MNVQVNAAELTGAQTYPYPAHSLAAPRTGRRRWLWAGLLVLAIAAAAAAYYFYAARKHPAAAPAQLPTVSVIVPGQSTVSDRISATGSIMARREMPVGVAGEGGQVTAIRAEAGQFVRAGQVLAEIDRTVTERQIEQLAAGVQQARADAHLAAAELDRARALVTRGFISKSDIDKRTATLDGNNAKVRVADAQLGEARARLARLDIRAPADGLVLQRNVEAGQIVSSAGAPLFRIAKDGQFEMRASVAEQEMARLRVGQSAQVTPVGATTPVPGRIWLLDPMIDAASRQGVARIALGPDGNARVGAFANAVIASGETVRPVLPQSAVQVDDKGSYVLVIGPGDKVARRPVTVGEVSARGLSIVSGLAGNERVVVSAGAFLQPGEAVRPLVVTAAQLAAG